MKKWAYYNDSDPYVGQWVRNLIAAGHITPGEVDNRPIQEVHPDDVKDFLRVHFFCGLGGWDHALNLSNWGSRPVWTGSCPCQPFSAAQVAHGGAQGQRDARHLWPEFLRIIKERKPDTIFGEQIGDAIGWGWWDDAAMDLEEEAYACAAQILRADAFGAMHRRKRLFWLAHAGSQGRQGYQPVECLSGGTTAPHAIHGNPLVDARRFLAERHDAILLGDGVSVGVERSATKGYGNAIVPQVAAQFIAAFMECGKE